MLLEGDVNVPDRGDSASQATAVLTRKPNSENVNGSSWFHLFLHFHRVPLHSCRAGGR
jgi:hypothetical protein